MDTWNPTAYGLRFQRDYQMEPIFAVVEDRRELGNVKSVAVADKPLRTFRGLRWVIPNRDGYEYAVSFWNRNKGPAARVTWSLPEYVPTPDAPATLTAVVSGSQAARTIFVRYAWKNANGRTKASPATSLLVPLNNLLVVKTAPYPPGVTQAVIYATQGSAGTEQEQVTLTSTRTWTQPNAALLLATASVPTANTCLESVTVKLSGTYQIRRGQGVTYELTLDLEEAY